MSIVKFIINNSEISEDINSGYTLLEFIRNNLNLKGTKEGCREGDCGACSVILGELKGNSVKYNLVNSCLLPVSAVIGKHIITIEGINQESLNLIQEMFVDELAVQCGFCTPGFILAFISYLLGNTDYNADDAIAYMSGNICRCTGNYSIRNSASKILDKLSTPENIPVVDFLINKKIIPPYFLEIPKRLKKIQKNNVTADFVSYPVSGGTDLYVQKWNELIDKEINAIGTSGKQISSNFKRITANKQKINIGGGITIEELRTSDIVYKHFPSLKYDLKLFGSAPIRNRATVAGNIVNASPIGDIVNIFLALGCEINTISSTGKKRKIPLRSFYIDYKKVDLKKDEIIDFLSFGIPAPDSFFNFEKISRRKYLDIASVNSTIYLEHKDNAVKSAGMSAGGVFPYPLYLSETCKYLEGKAINSINILNASNIAAGECSPISDARGSAGYKKTLLKQLIIAHFVKFSPELIKPSDLL